MDFRKILTRLFIALLALLGLGVLLVGGTILFDSLFPSQRVTDFTNLTYPGPDGVTLHAYLARPQVSEPSPAILLVHEFFGINGDIVKKADLLAEQGYTVLAVDAYRGKTTTRIPIAIWRVLTTPRQRILADLDAGFAHLSSIESVDAQKIGAVGFCFGGTQVMHMATQNSKLAATVIFYGSGPITNPTDLGAMPQGGPVLGIFGENDQSIPLEQVEGFEQAMGNRGVRHRVSIYPGVGHAFVNTQALAEPGAAQEAWDEMLGFLSENLRNSPSS